MFDAMSDTTFWPLFLIAVLLISAAAGIGIGALIRWVDTRPQRGEWRHMASVDRVRRQARGGFKSRSVQ